MSGAVRGGPGPAGASRKPDDRPRPLAGVLVVSLEQAVAAPLATRKLADAGARVVKVERPGGDFARGYDRAARGLSAYFVWLNRGKESIVLDIKDEADAGLLDRIVATADVFVQNLGPGAAERAGFGSGALRERHPRLVTCDVSGYGPEGPYAGMKAYDNLLQAETGLHAVTGHPDRPARVGISVCDIAAGMHAYGAVLEALLLRERTGEGAGLEVSLFSAMADWMSVPYLHAVHGDGAPPRTGLRHPSIAPYGPYRSGEGDEVLIAVQNEREWTGLCRDALGRPELADDPRFRTNPDRVANREELMELLDEAFQAFGTGEMLDALADAGIAHGRRRTVEGFGQHPALRLGSVETAEGPVALPADPVGWRGWAGAEDASAAEGPASREKGHAPERDAPARRGGDRRVPELDEHGDAIRREFSGG